MQGKGLCPGRGWCPGSSFTLKFLFKQRGELQLLTVWSSSGPSSSRCQCDTGKRAMTGCGDQGRPSYIIQRGRRTQYTTGGEKQSLTWKPGSHLAQRQQFSCWSNQTVAPSASCGHPPPTWRRPWRQHPRSARHIIHSASFDRLKPTDTHQFSFLSPPVLLPSHSCHPV